MVEFSPKDRLSGVLTPDGGFAQSVLMVSETGEPVSLGAGQAERVVLSTYGDKISVSQKSKNLNKFGVNSSVGTTFETLAKFPASIRDETFVSTNLIDAVVSTSASDTQTIQVEGHTIDGSGNLTFTVQSVTLSGQTPVALPTPMARANRAFIKDSGTFNSPQANPVGQISIYDDTDGATAGVPNTDAAVKLIIEAGRAQTEKCATAISSNDYWLVTYFSCAFGDAANATDFATVRMEIRDVFNGSVWRPLGRDYTLQSGVNGIDRRFNPLLIVPKNHDFRVIGRTNASTAEIYAEVGGYLAGIVT